ncbi:MAG TPA: RluA family pseudouridine synthase [Bacillaceae bacterium]|nr:RluA family pseudouridine synthase [Bacillaceae bacterium]
MIHTKIRINEQWANLSLQQLFRDIWQAPKKLTHELRMSKNVSVNGEIGNWAKQLNVGDMMEIVFSDSVSTYKYYEEHINVLYEDEHLFVVNKRANMQTHPNTNETDTLLNAVAAYFHSKDEDCFFQPVHRLDKDTTGAILFAKNPLSLAVLHKLLEERAIKRTYWALADGLLKAKQGKINEPIGRDRHHATRRRVSKTGQTAITNYRVVKLFPEKRLSLIECQLDTGRTHQIRVHLQHIGHPLAGDTLYGGSPIFPRQALHAKKIEFIHPFTLEKINVEAPFLDSPPIFPKV